MSEKKMTFFAAIDNFWYYHKWKVAAVLLLVVAIIAGVGFINANTDNRDYDFCITSVFARPMTTGDYSIDKQLEEIVTDVDKNGDVALKVTNYYITEEASGDNDKISLAQFESDLTTAKGDLLLFDKANLDRFLPKDFFADISDYVDLAKIPEEDIVYRKNVPVAVRLTDSKALSDMNFIIDDIYVSVMFTPEDANDTVLASRELAKAAAEKLLK